MTLPKRTIISFFSLFFFADAFSQFPRVSIATDFGIQRSFKKEQQYWAVGHTVQGLFHFTTKGSAYVWISYYSNGVFRNQLTANARSILTIPQQINYSNEASMSFKHVSMGWKTYIKGGYDMEEDWGVYGYAGFGLMMGRVTNIHSPAFDTAKYDFPVNPGFGSFKRLTLDLGAGWEAPLGADIFVYAEGRVWIPTTDYPSKFIFVNTEAPVTGMLNAGFRILF